MCTLISRGDLQPTPPVSIPSPPRPVITSMEHHSEAEPMGIEECVQEGDALGGIDIHSLVCPLLTITMLMLQCLLYFLLNLLQVCRETVPSEPHLTSPMETNFEASNLHRVSTFPPPPPAKLSTDKYHKWVEYGCQGVCSPQNDCC